MGRLRVIGVGMGWGGWVSQCRVGQALNLFGGCKQDLERGRPFTSPTPSPRGVLRFAALVGAVEGLAGTEMGGGGSAGVSRVGNGDCEGQLGRDGLVHLGVWCTLEPRPAARGEKTGRLGQRGVLS